MHRARLYCSNLGKEYTHNMDDDYEVDEFCRSFLQNHVRAPKVFLLKLRASTEKLKAVAAPPATSLDLKAITERLVNTVDRDEVFLWENEPSTSSSILFCVHTGKMRANWPVT
jgi:hypothetical protein